MTCQRTLVRVAATAALLLTLRPLALRADEQLFGFTEGAETLPKGKIDLTQVATLRTGKDQGTYQALDLDSEFEYGFTDRLQGGLALIAHRFDVRGLPDFDDGARWRAAGAALTAKYRLKSPFVDGYGLAVSPVVEFLRYDDVGGFIEHELLAGCTIVWQHNFLDDTLILAANAGASFTWGKKPAENYDHELLVDAGTGLSYRFARGWFAGLETTYHAEYTDFDVSKFEHLVVFAGPSLHYATDRWWTTLSWVYQVYGQEVDQTVPHKAYAEESRSEIRLKVGFSF